MGLQDKQEIARANHSAQLTDYQGSLFRRFTGKEKDSESGHYYFGARYFMPTLSIWNSVDPMADKYPSLSPYNYCAWNPIKIVDPDGRDDWEINSQGKIVNHIKNKNQDAFYMVDDKGHRRYTTDVAGGKNYTSISFKYGTVTGFKKSDNNNSTTGFGMKSESAGADLFRFFADNKNIEYGLINTESNGSIVMTNHKKGSVGVTGMALKMNNNGINITSIVHSHPGNSGPSGFSDRKPNGDKLAALSLTSSNGNVINRYVYTPKNGNLIMYDEHEIIGPTSWGCVFSPSTERINPRVHSYPGVGLPPR